MNDGSSFHQVPANFINIVWTRVFILYSNGRQPFRMFHKLSRSFEQELVHVLQMLRLYIHYFLKVLLLS